jgi:hypothetical protein
VIHGCPPGQVLPDLRILSRVNQCWRHSGLDSPDHCVDRAWFDRYPHAVEYHYNDRGFRDLPWPTDRTCLQTAIWCIGDSFTVGLGSPRSHTWPYLLQQTIGQRTINVSMDGASNDWICRRAQQIIDEIQPSVMIILWSYIHRRETMDHIRDDELRRIDRSQASDAEDYQHFQSCVSKVRGVSTQVLHYVIPDFKPNIDQSWLDIKGPDWPSRPPKSIQELAALPQYLSEEIKQKFYYFDLLSVCFEDQACCVQVPRLDIARDGHHFDLLTAQWLANHVVQKLEG